MFAHVTLFLHAFECSQVQGWRSWERKEIGSAVAETGMCPQPNAWPGISAPFLGPHIKAGPFLVLYVKYFFLAKLPMACSGSSLTIEIDGCLRKTLTCFEI